MHEAQGWLLDARSASVALAVYGAVTLLHAIWRSRGQAAPDLVRESGPIL